MSVGIESAVKECGSCGQMKQVIAFHTYKGRDGSRRRFGICKECRKDRIQESNDKFKDWRKQYNESTRSKRSLKGAARRAAAKKFVDEYKARPCADCGKQWPPVAMDLDHIRDDKFKSVASMVSAAYRLDLIKEELVKCDVVCACCHRIRTASRGQNLCFPPREAAPRPKTKSIKNEKLIEHDGETRSISSWGRKLGIHNGVISYRLRKGYSVKDALNTNGFNIGNSPVMRVKKEMRSKC